MKPLFWEEEPASKPIIRATYFLQKGHGWLPYSEKDSELLEVCVCVRRCRRVVCLADYNAYVSGCSRCRL